MILFFWICFSLTMFIVGYLLGHLDTKETQMEYSVDHSFELQRIRWVNRP